MAERRSLHRPQKGAGNERAGHSSWTRFLGLRQHMELSLLIVSLDLATSS